MRKLIVLLAMLCCAGSAFANDIWDDFSQHVSQNNVRAFTKDLGGDAGLSSALNSISIVISIFCMVGLLLVSL